MNPFQAIKLLLIITLLWSCSSDKLSRDKAKKIIAETNKLPISETEYFYKYYTKHDHFVNENNEIGRGDMEMLNDFTNKALITTRRDTTYKTDAWGEARPIVHIYIELSNDGKKYLITENEQRYTIKTNELDIAEVTGLQINENSNSATAEYLLKRINWTPFGDYYKVTIPHKYPETISRSVNLKKYDDGWRINNSEYE